MSITRCVGPRLLFRVARVIRDGARVTGTKNGSVVGQKRCISHHYEKQFGLQSLKSMPSYVTVNLEFERYNPGKKFIIDDSKTPVLMLHGLFGSKRDYQSTAKRICQITGNPIFGIDLRNHGNSPHGLPHTYESMAHDVIKFLETENWNHKPIIVGHSMGAKVAMVISLLRPELLSKLVVIDNAPVSQELDVQFYKDLVGMCRLETEYPSFIDKSPLVKIQHIDKVLLECEPDEKVRFFLKTNIITKNSLSRHHTASLHHGATHKSLFRVPVLQFLKHNVLDSLGDWPKFHAPRAFTKPTLILKAKESEFIHSQDQFSHLFPKNTYLTYDCGHWIVSEAPSQFIDDMVKFISDDN